MIYIGLIGHSHIQRLHRHWHHTEHMRTVGLPRHTHLLQYMHTDPSDPTHYRHITINHPYMTTILISWGDNDIDQPGETISNGITYDIIRSLISLLLHFIHNNVTAFIIPPLPRPTPSLTTPQLYRTAALNITHTLARHINDLRIPYTPLINLPALTIAEDGVHPTFHSYEALRTTIITHIHTQYHGMQLLGINHPRTTTPLLPTPPNITPSETIYLPTLPTYINHRSRQNTTTTTSITTTTTFASCTTTATTSGITQTSALALPPPIRNNPSHIHPIQIRRTQLSQQHSPIYTTATNTPLTTPCIPSEASTLAPLPQIHRSVHIRRYRRHRVNPPYTTLSTIHEDNTEDSADTLYALPPPLRDPEPSHRRHRTTRSHTPSNASQASHNNSSITTPHSLHNTTLHTTATASSQTCPITTLHTSLTTTNTVTVTNTTPRRNTCTFISRGLLSSVTKR